MRVRVDEAVPGERGGGGLRLRAAQVLDEALALRVLRLHAGARHAHGALRHARAQRLLAEHHPADSTRG